MGRARTRHLLALLLTVGVLAGCGTATSARPPAGAGAGQGTTVDNCGRSETFEQPPQRVVSLNQHTTENLLAIVLVDYLGGGGSVRDKPAFLEGHPLASQTPVVRHDRYITLELVQLIEGVRFPGAVEHLARALHGE